MEAVHHRSKLNCTGGIDFANPLATIKLPDHNTTANIAAEKPTRTFLLLI